MLSRISSGSSPSHVNVDLAPVVSSIKSLLLAFKDSDVDAVRALLQQEPALAKRTDIDRGTALFWAVFAACGKEIIATLLEAGADVNAGAILDPQVGRLTPLMAAAGSNSVTLIETLVEHGADVNAHGDEGLRYTAVMHAALVGHCEAIKALLRAGADPNLYSSDGMTAALIAATNGHNAALQALVDGGADNSPALALARIAMTGSRQQQAQRVSNQLGAFSPTMSARTDSVVASSALKDVALAQLGPTPETLYQALQAHDDETVLSLLQQQPALARRKNSAGQPPLFSAVLNGCSRQVIEALLDAGADIEEGANHGFAPLMVAAEFGHVTVIETLVERGANVNAQSNGGNTALMGGARLGYIEVIDALLRAGADPNVVNRDGLSAAGLAATNDFHAVYRALLDGGADINSPAGRTASRLVADQDQQVPEVVQRVSHELGMSRRSCCSIS